MKPSGYTNGMDSMRCAGGMSTGDTNWMVGADGMDCMRCATVISIDGIFHGTLLGDGDYSVGGGDGSLSIGWVASWKVI